MVIGMKINFFSNTLRGRRVNPVMVKCSYCGYQTGFIERKKQICPRCYNYIYPDKKEEFIERFKKVIK